MDDKHGLLTLAAYLTAAMLIVVVACLGIFHYGGVSRVSTFDAIPVDSVPDFAVAQFDLGPNSAAENSTSAVLDRQRIRLLETMLSEKTELLREQAEMLARQSTDLQDLRKRYDEAMMLAAESLQQDSESDNDALDEHEAASNNTDALDPMRLDAELSVARAVHEALVSDLESVQNELARAYEELARLREETDRESSDRLRDALVLEAASAGVLSRIGRDAVPALTQALTHTSPIVRRWAATVLGGIGSDAGDAVAALKETLSDADPNVRRAAKTALDAIER